ncbi:MAG: beta-galactosidase [Defluviitaleaceae bacterium]|nr:beta-galactosidase [Defluviitaleaceae bacterium]
MEIIINGVKSEKTLPDNWQGFKTLQFTLNNTGERPGFAGFNIYDQASQESPDLEYGDCVEHGGSILAGEGIIHVVVEIAPISTRRGNRMLDLCSICKLEIVCGENITVSNLRLSHAAAPDPSPSPGDSIVHIKHLDIHNYTHQPELYQEPDDIAVLKQNLDSAMTALSEGIRIAEINGRQVHYERATLLAAEVASKSRAVLAWHFGPKAKRRNLSQALALVTRANTRLRDFLSSRRHDDDEDDSNVSLSRVKPVPDLGGLAIEGDRFVSPNGEPVLVCSMSYHNEGVLLDFFAPERHKLELYAVGGGSRYDIEQSPVYQAFHQHPNTARVGWRGWCGHLIKDQWSMGGLKENVVLCLENEHILSAISEYNRIHAPEWVNMPGLMYVILAYELTYLCYCETSIAWFRQWLQERHGSIATVNDLWGTAYSCFDEITPPPTSGHGPKLDINRAPWYDWADWNMRRFTNHLKWTYDDIRKYHPTMPICAGGSSSMLSANIGTTGIDEELIINEIDDVILHEGRDVMSIDLFHALSDKPRPMVDPEQGGSCDKWFLNYLHGKSTIAMFWWPRQPSRQFPSSTMFSPAHGDMPIEKVLEHLTTALDVRRLTTEITAFWDMPKDVAILYSRTTMIQADPAIMTAQTTPYLKALQDSYEAARCMDTGVTFISEKQLIAGLGGKYKLIVLPAVRNLPEKVFNALDAYVRQGGHVVVVPEALLADEYNRPQDYLKRWGISIGDTFAPVVESMGEAKQRYDQNLERAVHFGAGKAVSAQVAGGIMEGLTLKTKGLFQQVWAAGDEADTNLENHRRQHIAKNGLKPPIFRSVADVIFRDSYEENVLLDIPLEKGQIWYLAGTPDRDSLSGLLDRAISYAGIERLFKVTDKAGNRVAGLEARMVQRNGDVLVYVSNEGGGEVEFFIQTDKPYQKVRELRAMEYYEEAAGVIKPDQVLLFSFK